MMLYQSAAATAEDPVSDVGSKHIMRGVANKLEGDESASLLLEEEEDFDTPPTSTATSGTTTPDVVDPTTTAAPAP